jgi:hypothetical protein
MFIVENGSIVAGANSLVDVAYANTYHLDRGNTGWDGSDAVKQAALIKATDYIQEQYSFRGELVQPDQTLNWPRYGIPTIPYDIIPDRLKQAVCILALEVMKTPLNPSIPPNGQVKFKKVDVIETEYFAATSTTTKRPAVDGLLRQFLTGSAINASVVRV